MKIYFLLSILIFTLISCHRQKNSISSESKIKFERNKYIFKQDQAAKYYQIDISIVNCGAKVLVNDIEIISLDSEEQLRTYIPINNGILSSGKQKIEIKSYPISKKTGFSKDSRIICKVVEFDKSSGKPTLVKEYKNVEVKPPLMSGESYFEAEVPYEIKTLDNAINLKDSKVDIKKSLISEYNKVINLFSSNNEQGIIDFITNTDEKYKITLYLSKIRLLSIIK